MAAPVRDEADLPEPVAGCLPPGLRAVVAAAWLRAAGAVEEVRLRQGQPLHLVGPGGDWFCDGAGQPAPPAAALIVDGDLVARAFQLLAQGSVYAWEEELRGGFITLAGGHRVGVCGRALVAGGRVAGIRPITGLNIRIARAVPGAAAGLVGRLARRGGGLHSTLLISPPRAGKTTVLRDLVRLASRGHPALGGGLKAAVVDERSELAGCVQGVPQHDLGPRTDVLDACPKAEGMMLAVRALSPQVLAVDEIGRDDDARAVLEAVHAGVAVLASAHGHDLSDVAARPGLGPLLGAGAFARAVVLGRSRGPGTVEAVLALPGGRPLAPGAGEGVAGG